MDTAKQRSVQISQNYRGLFQDWELQATRCLIRGAQRENLCLRGEGFEDLLQECLVHWFFTKGQYRAEEGAGEKTFLNRIIGNKLADIARIKGAYKRKVLYVSESLDAMGDDEESVGKKERALMVEEQIVEKITTADLPDAMARATANLYFRQKQICQYLSEGMSQVQVGEKMNIPRTTLQSEIKRIREVFRKEGLEEYLR